MTPLEIVQRQLDAHNAHDLQAFLATYAESIRLYAPPASEPTAEGRAALAELYSTKVFNVPTHRAELLGRMAFGNKVVDHERVFGLADGPFEAVAVYEVADGLIQSVWLFRG